MNRSPASSVRIWPLKEQRYYNRINIMFFKVFLVTGAILAFAAARPQGDNGHDHHHGHGHAFSSQSIVVHHEPVHYEEHHKKHEDHHHAGHHEEHHEKQEQHHHTEHHEEHHKKHEEHHKKQEEQHKKHEEHHHTGHHEEQHKKPEEHHHKGHHEEHHAPATSSQRIVQHHGHATKKHVEYYSHPKYEFSYKVEDPHTGDKKSQHESRDGDVVKGVYSLHDADGTIRIVEYSSDKKTGFNADVKREGHAVHIVPEHHHHH